MVTRPKCSRLVTVAKFQDGLPIDEPLQEHSRFELFLIYTQAIILYLLRLRFTFARFLFFRRLAHALISIIACLSLALCAKRANLNVQEQDGFAVSDGVPGSIW